jgi:hypothetical protein
MSIFAGDFQNDTCAAKKKFKLFSFSSQGVYDFRGTIDELILPDFIPPVDGKLICRGSDRKNNTIVVVHTYMAVKRGFPVT